MCVCVSGGGEQAGSGRGARECELRLQPDALGVRITAARVRKSPGPHEPSESGETQQPQGVRYTLWEFPLGFRHPAPGFRSGVRTEGWEKPAHSAAGPPAGWRSASGSSPTRCSPCQSHSTEAWGSWPPAPLRSSLSSSSPPSPVCHSAGFASALLRSPRTTAPPFGSRWPPVRTERMG